MAALTIPDATNTAGRKTLETWFTQNASEWVHNMQGGYHVRTSPTYFFSAEPGEKVDVVEGKVKKTTQKKS